MPRVDFSGSDDIFRMPKAIRELHLLLRQSRKIAVFTESVLLQVLAFP